MSAAEFLTPLELDFLWESLGAGELPYPLELRSHGGTLGERGALRQRTLAELQRRQLLDPTGRLTAPLEDLLVLLAQPETSVDSVFLSEQGGDPQRMLAAASADRAVLVRQDAQGVHLWPVPAGSLASSIVAALPPAPRGAEKSINVPADELNPGQRPGSGRATDEDTRQALGRLLGQQRWRGGQIAANARGRVGGKNRSRVLAWFDTESGRYLTQSSTGTDGREWIVIAPADAPTLRHRVGELLRRAHSAVAAR